MKVIKNILNKLFSSSASGLYMILFAIAIAVATFIENDFGTSAAQKLIFKAWWFELLLGLFGISILVNIFRFRLIQQKKWATFAFHASILIILLGAAVTRYFGFEGMMHIRESGAANSILSADTYLVFEAEYQGQKYTFDDPVLFASLGKNTFQESYLLGDKEINVELTEFLPNPKEVMIHDDNGVPTIKIVIGGVNGREEYFLKQGQRSRIRGTLFNFRATEEPHGFNIKYDKDGQLFFKAPTTFTQMQMATRQVDTLPPNEYHLLYLKSMYSSGQQRFVFGEFSPSASVELSSTDRKMSSTSMAGLKMRVSSGQQVEEQYIFGGKGLQGRQRVFNMDDLTLKVAYGSKMIQLPFELHLRDFILEKYPGTNSASSYASEVTLVDPRSNYVKEQRIFMNNILNYDGYRFFQSSFDQDELGTYLSVNHDWWGTWISYLGYAILTIGMIMTFFNQNSRFRELARRLKKAKQKQHTTIAGLVIGFLMCSVITQAYTPEPNRLKVIDKVHSEKFGQIIIQDHRGRMKPMNTYASEILRKLSRKESMFGLTAEQIILEMATNPRDWYDIPLIKAGKHDKTNMILPTKDGMLSYSDFFETDGSYKLKEHVRTAYNTPKKDRGVFEKEMMKLDEKVNIISMVYSGSFLKVFPVAGDENNSWISPGNSHHHNHTDETDYPQRFYEAYTNTVRKALVQGDWTMANQLLDELRQYQTQYGAAVLPSASKIKAEILLNELKVFSRLAKWYGLLGLAFLALLFASVFKPNINLKAPSTVLFGLFALCFLFHTFGLGLRWYVSGRAPWSNGYESMIYIGFTTVLAGLIFGRKSLGSLTATCILASTILLVAGLSWLDPEITPLVPVLRSYWLTIHVSLEAGSYGFLMLGALIGALNLIFMIFRTKANAKHVNRIITEMTQISEMTLIGGLFMISIGTYLGGVWANESWGRYWGWDAKETWALVTILIYAFILHMRFIPGMRGAYAFNVASLFGWASVIMTYFGVNYYLSGLHSYAAGDPVPIPAFVYYAVGILTLIGVLAFWRNQQYKKWKAT
jgi:cytochrome c-type biogenesis protein CcsB